MSGKLPGKSLCTAAVLAVAAWSAAASCGTPSSISASDTQFSQKAAAAGAAEVQLGELALKKSSSNGIKSLASRIVDDHRKADDELASLGSQKRIELPTSPDADADKSYAKLNKESARAFDQTWLKMIIKDHQVALKLFTTEARKGKDEDLRKFAAATVPTLQGHLDSAKQIAAVPDARDKAMDSTMNAMRTADVGSPATAATAAAPTSTPMPVPTKPVTPATASSLSASPQSPPGQKH